MKALRVVFAGTPAFGIPCLEAIAQSAHSLVAIYTQPDRPAGRGRSLQASAVKTWGLAHAIPVYQPVHFKEESTIRHLQAQEADIMVVIAYGLIVPKSVLATPVHGCINVHASLLPRWRGAAPIQYAILHGDQETGITIMQMDAGMDTGAILAQRTYPIGHETAAALSEKLARLAVAPLLATLDAVATTGCTARAQEENFVTYAGKIAKSDAAINWQDSAFAIDCQIRAFYPWPVAYTHSEGTLLRIHAAEMQAAVGETAPPGTILSLAREGMVVATGEGAICVKNVQFPGGKVLTVADCLHARSHPLVVGALLT